MLIDKDEFYDSIDKFWKTSIISQSCALNNILFKRNSSQIFVQVHLYSIRNDEIIQFQNIAVDNYSQKYSIVYSSKTYSFAICTIEDLYIISDSIFEINNKFETIKLLG